MYDKVEKIAQNNRIPLEFAAHVCVYIYIYECMNIYICMNELNISMITILNFDYWWGADTFPISRFIIFAVRNYFTRCNTVVLFFSVTIIL